jgi:hypothetical protein
MSQTHRSALTGQQLLGTHGPSRLYLGYNWLACSFDLAEPLKALSRQAGRAADKHTLLWAKQHGLLWDESLFGAAEARGLDLCKWLLKEQGCPWRQPSVAFAALKNCDLDMLQWLRRQMPGAAETFQAVVRTLLQLPDGYSFVHSIVAISWLEQHFFLDLQASAVQLSTAAAKAGALGALKWLHRRGCLQEAERSELSRCRLIVLAAQHGHLAVVRYLHEERALGSRCVFMHTYTYKARTTVMRICSGAHTLLFSAFP